MWSPSTLAGVAAVFRLIRRPVAVLGRGPCSSRRGRAAGTGALLLADEVAAIGVAEIDCRRRRRGPAHPDQHRHGGAETGRDGGDSNDRSASPHGVTSIWPGPLPAGRRPSGGPPGAWPPATCRPARAPRARSSCPLRTNALKRPGRSRVVTRSRRRCHRCAPPAGEPHRASRNGAPLLLAWTVACTAPGSVATWMFVTTTRTVVGRRRGEVEQGAGRAEGQLAAGIERRDQPVELAAQRGNHVEALGLTADLLLDHERRVRPLACRLPTPGRRRWSRPRAAACRR